jgi:hypothetical protein
MMEECFEPIMAKEWMMKNWDKYEMPKNIKTRDEFLGLLNILQSHNLTLEDMHNAVFNGYTDFMYFSNFNGWETMDDLCHAIFEYNMYMTDEEFIDWIIEQHTEEIPWGGYDDPTDEIRQWTYGKDFMFEGHPIDTMIRKTEDGYVKQITY